MEERPFKGRVSPFLDLSGFSPCFPHHSTRVRYFPPNPNLIRSILPLMANPGDFAYTVKQQADIVRIIGDYVKLKKAGAQNYSGLCPFHSEKTPSFSVHATRQFYHCFGCGVSGDVFSFVQKIENITFPESVRMVAQKLGIPLPKASYSTPGEAKEARLRGQLLDVHERAVAFFQECLQPSRRRPRPRISDGPRPERGNDRELPHRLCAGFRVSSPRSAEGRIQRRGAARERAVLVERGCSSELRASAVKPSAELRRPATLGADGGADPRHNAEIFGPKERALG